MASRTRVGVHSLFFPRWDWQMQLYGCAGLVTAPRASAMTRLSQTTRLRSLLGESGLRYIGRANSPCFSNRRPGYALSAVESNVPALHGLTLSTLTDV